MEKNENGFNRSPVQNGGLSDYWNGNGSNQSTDRRGCAGTGPVRQPGTDGNGEQLGAGEGALGSQGGGCSERQLAMMYSPYQCWHMLYSPDDALAHGTMFRELYKPLGGKGDE